ncbi:MAG TPA: YgiQ family radical SAM protein, partial [Candidatus Wallbacteria bacterium]|nr:YgiQ family radical SAM protein [Candidatus Wallbacteria bacterium]
MDFLPTTKEELIKLKIDRPDIIIVTGDTYIDSPFIGAAVIGRYLRSKGFTVAIIAQPDINGPDDITRLGEPNLFWGVTGGSIDSMVANYTPMKKFR